MRMIERVARAIMDEAVSGTDLAGDFVWHDYLPEAIAAISAMREPTEAMKQAVDTAENDMGVCHAAYEQIDWETAWKVAIDAALKETPNAHDR